MHPVNITLTIHSDHTTVLQSGKAPKGSQHNTRAQYAHGNTVF